MRRQLCDEHVAVENQAAQLEDAMLRRLAKRRLAGIEADIRLLDKRLAEMIAADPDLARRYARLTSMPGVGPVLAFTLIALLGTATALQGFWLGTGSLLPPLETGGAKGGCGPIKDTKPK